MLEQNFLTPVISEEQRKQDIFLSTKFFADLTLKSLLDLIDISDPSMVNVLYKEIARLYQSQSTETFGVSFLKDNVKEETDSICDETAKKFLDTFT